MAAEAFPDAVGLQLLVRRRWGILQVLSNTLLSMLRLLLVLSMVQYTREALF